MRTIEIKLYNLHELSEDAQEKAFNDWSAKTEYLSHSENEDTLNAFKQIFPVHITRYEYGLNRPCYINWEFTDDEHIKQLDGVRLIKYLWNNYQPVLYKPKFLYKGPIGVDSLTGYSKIQVEKSCNLTGYTADIDMLEPFWEFMDGKGLYRDFKDLCNEALENWIDFCRKDMEDYFSFENFEFMASANEWEFDENGNLL